MPMITFHPTICNMTICESLKPRSTPTFLCFPFFFQVSNKVKQKTIKYTYSCSKSQPGSCHKKWIMKMTNARAISTIHITQFTIPGILYLILNTSCASHRKKAIRIHRVFQNIPLIKFEFSARSTL